MSSDLRRSLVQAEMRRRRRKQGGCWSVEEEGNIQSVNSSRRQSSRNHSSADRKDPPHLRFIRVFIENLARKSSNDFISVVAREIVKVKCYKGRYSEKPKYDDSGFNLFSMCSAFPVLQYLRLGRISCKEAQISLSKLRK
eukprot:1325802-Amorphochlora_amoeboformis.AAC.1